MAKQVINIGAAPNDNSGDPLRDAFIKSNDNFTELYDGAGTVIADGSITTAKLDDDAVSYAKLGTEFTTSAAVAATDGWILVLLKYLLRHSVCGHDCYILPMILLVWLKIYVRLQEDILQLTFATTGK